jgi:hypothetical protein
MLAFIALLIALMALMMAIYASFFAKSSLVDMSEFASLDSGLKSAYKQTVVDILAPSVLSAANASWTAIPAEKRKSIVSELVEKSGAVSAMIRRQRVAYEDRMMQNMPLVGLADVTKAAVRATARVVSGM